MVLVKIFPKESFQKGLSIKLKLSLSNRMKILFLIFLMTLFCFIGNVKSYSTGFINNGNNAEISDVNFDSAYNTETMYAEYNVKDIPSYIKYSGNIKESVKWNDKLGTNLVLICGTDEKWNGDLREKELTAYHFILNLENESQLWKIYDFIKDCPVDITLKYIDNSFSLTDLDEDGIFETSFLYRLSCKSDVSSDGLKLIMHEGNRKYALRGTMKLIFNGETFQEGTMKVDSSFNTAPDEFLEFASFQWRKFDAEKLGD